MLTNDLSILLIISTFLKMIIELDRFGDSKGNKVFCATNYWEAIQTKCFKIERE